MNPNDRLLTDYLLRSLPEPEMERLDQLSIADDDFAARLSSAEDDLVDAYVRKELAAPDAARFQSGYLSSPRRREKVRFAEAFLSLQQRAATRPVIVRAGIRAEHTTESSWARFFGNWFGISRSKQSWSAPQWGLAAAALALVIAGGYLFEANRELRFELNRAEADQAALVAHQKDLENRLANQAAARSTPRGTEDQTASRASIEGLKIAAFVLAPSLRGSGATPKIYCLAAGDLVVLKLELEATDFPSYQVVIENSATRQAAWQSSALKSSWEGDKQVLSFAFRPALLKSANYLAELTGVRADGTKELVTSYPFQAVVK
jgi:hypothetical protein